MSVHCLHSGLPHQPILPRSCSCSPFYMLYNTHMHFYMYICILRSPYEGEHAGFFLGYLRHERRYKVHFFLALTHSCIWGWLCWTGVYQVYCDAPELQNGYSHCRCLETESLCNIFISKFFIIRFF